MKDVDGKVAFITGGSSGIGLGIERAFGKPGMKVVVTCRMHYTTGEEIRIDGGSLC